MAIWMREVDLRDVDFARHELGEKGVANKLEMHGFNLIDLHLFVYRISKSTVISY